MSSRPRKSLGRASLACTICRQRKVRCSGDLPSCKACVRRSEECTYAGAHPESNEVSGTQETPSVSLPSRRVIAQAVDIFFSTYGDFPFWFFRRHVFVEELARGEVPDCILLCQLSLVARFVEPCYHEYDGTIEASEHFAARAYQQMSAMYDQLTLTNVHCNLMLGLYEIGHGNEHQAWLRLGIASRICQTMALAFEISYSGDDFITAETKRRTFWSCYALERLLVNGRDRPLLVPSIPITTQLPTAIPDFVVGRIYPTSTLDDPISSSESLPSLLIRLIDILSRIVVWGFAGVGGRHLDARSPWLEDMPFSVLKKELQSWRDSLPSYLALSQDSVTSHAAAGQARIFVLLHLLYMTAGARLYRKYIPFISPPGYDPASGPCDGPAIIPGPEAPGFWTETTKTGIQFANDITEAITMLDDNQLDPWKTPLVGVPLLESCSFHIWCAHNKWESCAEYTGEPAKVRLTVNLRILFKMQESWPVAAFWIKFMRQFYERISLAQDKEPIPPAENRPPATSVKEALLHFDRSDREKEGLPNHIPLPQHDLFRLLY
ncbi:hypothetical protein BX600DRAFT_63555 [Xylariales sp. PMI_506]|nr:hypothetical protein BX600DRAFT_63555 [Xylariales sp. PMI_506]